MNNITKIISTVAGLYGIVIPMSGKSSQINSKPNVLLILVDDLGFKDTGYTGSDFYETPIIDSLARQSLVFNNAYACAGNSAPSRACLISGQFTPRHGVFAVYHTKRGPIDKMRLEPYPNNPNLPLECVTIAEAMAEQGYRTGMVGKWHLGEDSRHMPINQGFQYSRVDDIQNDENFVETGDPKNMYSEVQWACDFIEKAVLDNVPFFQFVSFHAVHKKWRATPEYIDYFKSKSPGNLHNEPIYAAMIKDMDDAIGIMIDKVREMGIADNTIVIFTSDNGGVPATSQAPLRGFKGCLYEGGIRVPFFIHNPKLISPGECDMPVGNVDIYATSLDFAGVSSSNIKFLDGISLKTISMKSSRKAKRNKVMIWHFPGYLDAPCPGCRDSVFRQRPSTVMLDGDWKITLFYEEWILDGGWKQRRNNGCIELYNLRNDPSESNNVANEYPGIRDWLLRKMLRWNKNNEVQCPSLKDSSAYANE